MSLCSSQSIIALPKYGKLVSQECSLGELLENKKAANSKKGVVGRMGKKAPIKARATHNHANGNKMILEEKFSAFTLLLLNFLLFSSMISDNFALSR